MSEANGTHEERYAPPAELAKTAHVGSYDQYADMYHQSIHEPDKFWGKIAEAYHWHKKWTQLRNDNFDCKKGPIKIEWFVGGETNMCYNCLDRHVIAGKGQQVAYYWEGNEEGERATFTYSQLLEKVCRIANVLTSMGVRKGDAVGLYLPMVAELPATMLACARIGAIHSVIFGGFSAESLADRLMDGKCRVLVTADGVMRGPKLVPLLDLADEALARCEAGGHRVEHVLVVERVGEATVSLSSGRLSPRHHRMLELMQQASPECPVTWHDAEHPLFMLYTSGSTGKPKGVLHTTGGYMIWAGTTFRYTFDYQEGDVYFCTADCGWITGHTYLAYGPMLAGATQVLFEGIPTHPTPARLWQIVERHRVRQLYTAPTAIRALMKLGDALVKAHDLSSLGLLGTVGEPINKEAWKWYYQIVGGNRCPVVDTWWQTETGGHMITPLPGATATKPGSATRPFFGVVPVVLDGEGREVEEMECSGYLAIKQSWPGMMRTLYGDHARFEETYFRLYDEDHRLLADSYYVTGDGCRRDREGYFWLTGRVDDVINLSGHRIGTAEVESALGVHESVAEAAVVGVPHEVKGETVHCFVVLKDGHAPSQEVAAALREEVRRSIGAFASPQVICFTQGLPKTRSGKIMRRILRHIAAGHPEKVGDVPTLADPAVMQVLIDAAASPY
mmetsp:Transcript_64432/g.172547  ORF Transcript_64432/g.172547 Transcript_64432/m.172547 type:complete len:675 (+) Transcript_64432:68-2092(+)